MKKIWEYILIGLAIFIPLGGIAYALRWASNTWDKITFTPYFVSADFKGLTLQDAQDILLSGKQKTINAVFGMEVKNDSNTAISFSGLKAKLYYNGTLLGQTSDIIAGKKYTAEAHNVDNPLQVTDSVTVTLSQATAQLLIDKILGKKPKIDYEIQLTIFGIPYFQWFPIKNNFEW